MLKSVLNDRSLCINMNKCLYKNIIIIFIETQLHYTIGKIIKYRWLGKQVG